MNLTSVNRLKLLPTTSNSPRPLLASFGRRRGRKLRAGKQGLINNLLPKITISLPEDGNFRLDGLKPDTRGLWLEIGFGGGEHLAHQAKLHPDISIIGCEPYLNGIGDLLKKIDADKLKNIRIYPDDARVLMERLPDSCLDKVFILYPDPWPKARHNKRRLISPEFLDELARVMKPDAVLQLATDHVDYATWMLERLLTHKQFIWNAETCVDWLKPPSDWIPTRYEKKRLAGVTTYLSFKRH